ncbi:MAG: ABC transporter substrate-binding protein [Gemmatimonadaceae bacterium]|nr:ABC transporter substrate-binding protein [Acetobacteraceae bacterium]
MTNLTRRAALFAVLAGFSPPVRAQDLAEAGPFIQRAGNELAELIAGQPSLPERRRRILPFLERVVDVDAVARFCLGRYWATATPQQQAEYLAQFRLVLANGVAGRLGEYRGDRIRVVTGRPDSREGGIHVPTTVERPGNRPNSVVWIVVPSGNTFRIIDVVAEGISLRLTQRSDYAAYLGRNGGDVGALIRAMHAQLS